uniref:Uncharacterized protein K02A2.6-like n=1 Tax=Saccoglossus kowalevskii TaxID=10224 RepID=A0ABM0M6B6_SACKO
LSVQDDVILWGSRVIVPAQGQLRILRLLHESHPGIVRMKAFSRNYVWWPYLDKDIEATVQSCNACQINAKLPPTTPMHPWEYPKGPWDRVHIDFAGPFLNRMFLIVTDAYSKWME